ncbi:hypothetical protein ID871_08315 [Streptomyces pratensis]|nr:hypothetical protein [Streptomyces pratensis]
MFHAGPYDVEHEAGERVGQLVQPGQSEAVRDEALERVVGVEPADEGAAGDPVAGDERVAALEGAPARVVLGEIRVHVDVVDVDGLDVEVGVRGERGAFLAQDPVQLGPDEVGQDGAADLGQFAARPRHHGTGFGAVGSDKG